GYFLSIVNFCAVLPPKQPGYSFHSVLRILLVLLAFLFRKLLSLNNFQLPSFVEFQSKEKVDANSLPRFLSIFFVSVDNNCIGIGPLIHFCHDLCRGSRLCLYVFFCSLYRQTAADGFRDSL